MSAICCGFETVGSPKGLTPARRPQASDTTAPETNSLRDQLQRPTAQETSSRDQQLKRPTAQESSSKDQQLKRPTAQESSSRDQQHKIPSNLCIDIVEAFANVVVPLSPIFIDFVTQSNLKSD